MAGVVAMASVIEDFDTQPCKKSRKDGGSPVVKTITNYFSPVAKPAEKPFSPPRSNNIMDYFNRKAPSSKEKTSSPETSKENCQTSQPVEKRTTTEAAVKQPTQKRSRKTSKAARKLIGAETASSNKEESCVPVEEPDAGRVSTAAAVGSCGVLGSDTVVQLAQLSNETVITAGKSERKATKTVVIGQPEKDVPQCDSNIKLKPELYCIELSPIVPSKDKVKQVKSVSRKCKKTLQQESKQSEPEEKEKESSLCDVSMEVNVDEASQLNNTVTISFEDFVKSQSQDCEEEDKGKEDEAKTEELDVHPLDTIKTEENVNSGVLTPQLSPRTLTIQAEVHAVSPKEETAQMSGKVASIFSRRKGVMSPVEVAPSPQTEAGQQPCSASQTVKRKSNVVLQEEDLELAVLESESTPKCSKAERKQFMAAFKQPSLEASKAKPPKNQGKQKQPEEKVLDDADKVAEDDTVIQPSTEQVPTVSVEENEVKKKPARKGRRLKAKEQKEAATTPSALAPTPPVEETAATVIDVDGKNDEPTMTSTPSIPAMVRRSTREVVVRQAPKATATTPVRKNRKHKELKDAAYPPDAPLPEDLTANVSTPKRSKSKHGVFRAEILCPPDTEQSPIRIKFTRVHKHLSKAETGNCTSNSKSNKATSGSKKQKQAKKLVEKAKVIQQSKKADVKQKETLRRSSRVEAAKKIYYEDEDSIICVEEEQPATPQVAPVKSKSQKSLRSLNDVLGKASGNKAVPGSKTTSLGQDKAARKLSAVISIFDDSSREGSENSQDDEQFKARREFLKSGLPESFRKQIAKTAATKEAYSVSCSSFHPVTHTRQQPNDCPVWSLRWPESSLLFHLKELWCQTYNPVPPVSGSLCVRTKPARGVLCERGCGWRPEISESIRQLLMQEISSCNPSFPVQKFISHFLKRRTDHQQQCSSSEAGTRVTSTTMPAETVGGKRKRMDDEGETTVKVAKKQRANSSGGNISPPEPTKRGGRTRRSQRSKPEEEAKSSVRPASIPSEDDCVIILDEESSGEGTGKDVVKEDVLWTDKYQPQLSSDIIGNTASVRRLHSWLREWKLRADREERNKQKDKKQEEGSNDSDWDCGEEESQDGEDTLCNTMLITGPTGVGKTAAVYACAQELGFKVFEVNASSQRSGRLILSQLKEATQSHQVDSQGVNAHKPTYFNSYSTSNSAGALRPGSSPRKLNSPRRVVSSPRKLPQSPKGMKRGGLAPTSLASFFKMGRPTNKETQNTMKKETSAASENKKGKVNECTSKGRETAVKSPTEKTNEEQSKKTATSLILFEEVDVIFDDDTGFLAGIKTFMTTTKRPVILTTSDPAFSIMFDGNFEEIHFKAPTLSDAGSFLQTLCLAEDTRTNQRDIGTLLRLNGCDIRQSLLQLQFWTRSGGGCDIASPMTHTVKNEAKVKPETEAESLPPCHTGCSESMLGLLNTEPEKDIWDIFKGQSTVEDMLCWELLTNSRRRGVDLLYSNMETLLPLPLTQLTTSTYKLEQPISPSEDCPPVQPKEVELPSCVKLLQSAASEDCADDGSPVKMSNRMRKRRMQDGLNSDSDSEDGFLSFNKLQSVPQAKESVKESLVTEKVKRKPLTPEERAKSVPVSQCLESIADFLDDMSFMDSSLLAQPEGYDNHRRGSSVSAVVKDGMTDESRVETERGSWVRGEHMLEISAAVEALSFHKCRVSAAEAWYKTQQLEGEMGKEAAAELTLPVAAHRQGYSFTQDGLCQPQLVQQRTEVIETLLSRGILGNRPAAALDYLPALRTICRSEQLKEQGKVKRRFLHYLDAIHLGLDKNTLQHLAADFP